MLQFPLSAAQSYYTVGPLECFGTVGSNHSELTREMELEASRFLYSLCRVVNPTTPEPRSSTPTLDYTEQETEPTTWMTTIPVITAEHVTPVTMTTKVSTIKGVVVEVSTSQPTSTDANIPSAHTSDEATQTVSDININSESPVTTSTPVVFSSSVISSDTPSNNTQALGDSNGDLTPYELDESTGVQNPSAMSWQLGIAWALLSILFLMFALGVGYIVNKRGGSLNCDCLFGVKKKKDQETLAEVYGFPEVRLRSRSGELDLSDVRLSMEAGSYNVKSGTIAYGESFYM